MKKKTINFKEVSFTQAINISSKWCQEWGQDLLSDEVLADRISEIIRTKNGLRGFFAYSLSDTNCYLLDKLPSALIFKFNEKGNNLVEIVAKNFIMSSAQIIIHKRNKNIDYQEVSENISDRCKNILKVLDSRIVAENLNKIIQNLDNLGNSMDNKTNYDEEQKVFIKEQIYKLSE